MRCLYSLSVCLSDFLVKPNLITSLFCLFKVLGFSGSLLGSLTNSEHLSVLLCGHHGDNGVGSHTEVVSWQTGPETRDSLSGDRLLRRINNVLVGERAVGIGRLLLQLRLQIVEGKGTDGRAHSRDHRRAEVDLEGGSFRA